MTTPEVIGSSQMAVATVAGSTGRANDTANVVAMLTRSPIEVVAIARAVVAARVRKTARAGRARGWPDRASAPACTVIDCSVPAAQVVWGAMVRTLPVPSQARVTGVAGSTWRAARTENGSIGVLNSERHGRRDIAVGVDRRGERRVCQRHDRGRRGGDRGGRPDAGQDTHSER